MSISALFAWFKALFSPRPAIIPLPDEAVIITEIRLRMAHLTHLATVHYSNYLKQWEAYIANIKAETESVVFITAAAENNALTEEYDSLHCKVLMQFNKHDNLFLDRGILSDNWDALRRDVIACPGSIIIRSSHLEEQVSR